jgi:hypothetical protein
MNEQVTKIWLCDCGRVHVETRNCRVSLTPAEFLHLVKRLADVCETENRSPQRSYLTEEACETDKTVFRFAQRQFFATPV